MFYVIQGKLVVIYYSLFQESFILRYNYKEFPHISILLIFLVYCLLFLSCVTLGSLLHLPGSHSHLLREGLIKWLLGLSPSEL